MTTSSILHSPLGKKNDYISYYKPDLLFPILRAHQREHLRLPAVLPLPFQGADIWNAYELSWLNPKGKPIVAVGSFVFPCTSSHLIESKSFKLYLNSFNNTPFDSVEAVQAILARDLSQAAGASVLVSVESMTSSDILIQPSFQGICLDEQEIVCEAYSVTPTYLETEEDRVTETLFSDLLKSNCPVTGQPDWASVLITYTGKKIDHEGLLKYIVSFRDCQEFHEQCVERIYWDIWQQCQPQKLFVKANYTRRGGLDINPYRSS